MQLPAFAELGRWAAEREAEEKEREKQEAVQAAVCRQQAEAHERETDALVRATCPSRRTAAARKMDDKMRGMPISYIYSLLCRVELSNCCLSKARPCSLC